MDPNENAPANDVLAGISAITIVGSAANATSIAAALAAAGHDAITVDAVAPTDQGSVTASADAERTRILALVDLCPETTMSASLRTAVEQGTDAGAFAIGLAQTAKSRGANVDQLRAGSVSADQLPEGGSPDAGKGKAKSGAEQASGILALAASAGIKAAAHLRKPA